MAGKKSVFSPAVLAAILGAALVLGIIVYQTLHLNQNECEVCMAFEGRTKCLTVKGATQADTLQTARDNACSYITTNRAEGFRCGQTPPASTKCKTL